MDEVHVPNEVLKQAEASEMHAQANYVNSGEFLRRFIRRIELKPQGEKYVECSKVSEQQQRGQLSNSDNEFTAGVIGSI